MRVFITLPTDEIPTLGANQWLGQTIGRRAPHVVAATVPLPCWGQWVFSTELDPEEVALFQVANPLGSSDRSITYFILPVSRVKQLRPVTYESITGRRWDEMAVTVLDRRKKRPNDAAVSWMLIWGSRSDAVTMRVTAQSQELLEITFKLASDFDFTKDYISLEQHTERPNNMARSGVKESWWLEHVAGYAPLWATFPPAWKLWVQDSDVQRSAEEYLLHHVPEATEAVQQARKFTSKENIIGAWHVVKDIVDRVLKEHLGEDVQIGKLGSNSWTAIAAMPIRIAQRIGNYVEADWVPPYEKPEFADPEKSGRVLLANPTGSYPKNGPGVGEKMGDRYHLRQEGVMLKQRVEPPKPMDYASPYR